MMTSAPPESESVHSPCASMPFGRGAGKKLLCSAVIHAGMRPSSALCNRLASVGGGFSFDWHRFCVFAIFLPSQLFGGWNPAGG